MLFHFIMMKILDLKLELREQFEIMYVRCVLKPVIGRNKKTSVSTEATGESLSDHEVEHIGDTQEVGDPLLHASSYAASKTGESSAETLVSND